MPRLTSVAVFTLAALLLLGTGRRAASGPLERSVPEGPPVALDGIVNPAEWGDALKLALDPDSHLHLKQFRGTLMVAFESRAPWPLQGNLTLLFSEDGEVSGMRSPGFVRINYEPMEHDRPHFIVHQGSKRVPDGRIVARRVFSKYGAGIEMAFNLGLLGLAKDKRPSLRFAAHWVRPGRRHVVWPEGLDFVGKPPQMPPDLASARRWSLLTGWSDPSAPGAFSKTDWKRFVDRDLELTRRGQEAHYEVNLLVEEWKKTKKRDGELEAKVFENFAWVARHESLTPQDLFAKVQTLRYLNRCTEAIGILDALVNHNSHAVGRRALFERAATWASMDRYPEAADDWTVLADRVGGAYAGVYRQNAAKALDRAEAYEAERRADAGDEGRHERPLVGLYTQHGLVVIELFAREVPKAVEHFLSLVESKFYDGTLFHRVHGDRLAQGGDPKSRDEGCEFAGRGGMQTTVPMEHNERRQFWRGTVGFARRDRPVNGSQFFIMTSAELEFSDPGEQGDKGYTCFGRVVSGMRAVDRIAYCDKLIKAVVLRR